MVSPWWRPLARRLSAILSRRPHTAARSTILRPGLELLEDRVVPNASPFQSPLNFEINQGQAGSGVNFVAHGQGYSVGLTAGDAYLALQNTAGTISVLDAKLVGGNTSAQGVALDQQQSVSNYFIGNDPSQWHTNVANYGKVEFDNVYNGVNLVYYGTNQGELEYDFVVNPGANPGVIHLNFQGAQGLGLDAQGNLVIHMSGGDVMQHAPVLYQTINGTQQSVTGQFVLEGGNQVGIAVGAYDTSAPLVIDPVLTYAKYLGGTADEDNNAFIPAPQTDTGGIATDASGNSYVVGNTVSPNFPTTVGQAFNLGLGGGAPDAFVAKYDSSGNKLAAAYYGGSLTDIGYGIAVDSSGSVYISGLSNSTDLPTPNGFRTTNTLNDQLAFVAKFSSNLATLNYGTYLGTAGVTNTSIAIGISLDTSKTPDSLYVTGVTNGNFSVKKDVTDVGSFGMTYGGGASDAFASKLNTAQTGANSLVWSKYLNIGGDDQGNGIAIGPTGDVFVTGLTTFGNVTLPGPPPVPLDNGFVTRVAANGSGYVYGPTLIGVSGSSTIAWAIAVDALSDAYITGQSATTTLATPTSGAAKVYQTANAGGFDAFVAKFSSTGSQLFFTYLGGNGFDAGLGIALDQFDPVNNPGFSDVYVIGKTSSSNFPLVSQQTPPSGATGGYGFVSKLLLDGTNLLMSTLIGGSTTGAASGINVGLGIAVNSTGSQIYATGDTNTDNFMGGSRSGSPRSDFDAWVANITSTVPTITGISGAGVTTDPAGNPSVPESTLPGSPAFTITVTGTNFGSNSVVYWVSATNGAIYKLTTTSATATQIIATMSQVQGGLASQVAGGLGLISEEGSFRIFVVNNDGVCSTSVPFDVAEVPVTSNTLLTAVSTTENSAATVVAANTVVMTFKDPAGGEATGLSEYSATIDWGDGTLPLTTATITLQSGSVGSANAVYAISTPTSHTYADEGDYAITVTITHGTVANFIATTTVTGTSGTGMFFHIDEVAVDQVSVTASASTNENTTVGPFQLLQFRDPAGAELNGGGNPAAGEYSVTVNWGDGGPTQTFTSDGLGINFVNLGGNVIGLRASHFYAEEGSYTISYSAITHGTVSGFIKTTAVGSTTAMTVNEVAVNAVSVTASATINENTTLGPIQLLQFTDPAGAELTGGFPASGEYSVTVTWGDPSSPTNVQTFTSDGLGTNFVSLGGNVIALRASHLYAEEGNYTISYSSITHGTVAGFITTTAVGASTAVTVNEVAVTIVPGSVHAAINQQEGPTGSLTLVQFQDPAGAELTGGVPTAGEYSATIDWGDGSPTTSGTITVTGSGAAAVFTVTGASHFYEEGSFNIKVTITHGTVAGFIQTTVAGPIAVTVTDPNIIVPATGPNFGGLSDGLPDTGTLISFTDPGVLNQYGFTDPDLATDYTVTVNWGDGSPTESSATTPAAFNFVYVSGQTVRVDYVGTHQYTTPPTATGVYNNFITIQLKHEAFAFQTAHDTLVMGARPVTASPGPTFTATEGNLSTTQTVATFTQQGGIDTNPNAYRADITWGDGTQSLGVVPVIIGSTGYVNASHTYAEEGNYSISVLIHHYIPNPTYATPLILDPAGPVITPATVGDAPLTAGAPLNVTAVEGQPTGTITLGSFIDGNPGAPISDFTITINWGDGTTSSGAVQSLGGGNFNILGTKPSPYAEEGLYTISIVVQDVGGQSVTVTANMTVADAPLSGVAHSFTGATRTPLFQSVATFTDLDPQGTVSDYTVTISWGDSTSSAGTVVANGSGGFDVFGTHVYGLPGTYTFTVVIRDAGGSSLTVTGTASLTASRPIIAVGADAGGAPQVTVFDLSTNTQLASFYAFSPSFTGGVRVAVADVTGDGIPDIIAAAGPGGGPQVRVFDGVTFQPVAGPLGSFYAMVSTFTGGLFVAAGDVNGDGKADIIVAADKGGGPQVEVFDGATANLLYSVYATVPTFTGGIRVAAGDIDGDGLADVITGAGPGGLAQVTIFKGTNGALLQSYFGFGNFTGGVYVAAGDVNGDGRPDIMVSAGAGGGPQVTVFDGTNGNILSSFYANTTGLIDLASPQGLPRTGVRVGSVYLGATASVVTIGGPGSTPLVNVLNGMTLNTLDSFFALDPTFRGGAFVGG